MPERDSRGRFLGSRQLLHFTPRVGLTVLHRCIEFRRRYVLTWPVVDSPAGRLGFQKGEDLTAYMDPAGDAVLVTFLGRTQRVQVERRSLQSGWYLRYLCPECGRPVRFLYRPGHLACQRCARLKWSSEGYRQARLERQAREAFGADVRIPALPFEARAVAE